MTTTAPPPAGIARPVPATPGDFGGRRYAVTWTRPDGRAKTSVFNTRAGLDDFLARHHLTLKGMP